MEKCSKMIYLLDITLPLYFCTHCSSVYLQRPAKYLVPQHFTGNGRRVHKALHLLEELLAMNGCLGSMISFFFSGIDTDEALLL